MDDELQDRPGDRVLELADRRADADAGDIGLVQEQPVVRGCALADHVRGQPHDVAAVADQLRWVGLEGAWARARAFPQCIQRRVDRRVAEVRADGLVGVAAHPAGRVDTGGRGATGQGGNDPFHAVARPGTGVQARRVGAAAGHGALERVTEATHAGGDPPLVGTGVTRADVDVVRHRASHGAQRDVDDLTGTDHGGTGGHRHRGLAEVVDRGHGEVVGARGQLGLVRASRAEGDSRGGGSGEVAAGRGQHLVFLRVCYHLPEADEQVISACFSQSPVSPDHIFTQRRVPRTWSLNLPVGANPGGLGC